MKFNENLKYLRKKENLTQEQLAEKLNVSRQAVTKWESGQAMPDIANLKDISVLFGVTIDELIGDEKTRSATTLDKKLKELPIQLIIMTLTVLTVIEELGVNNVHIMALILILVLPLEALYIKKFLTNRRIINLTNTEDGKKARKRMVVQDTLKIGCIGLVLETLIYVVRRMQGLETQSILELISVIAIYFIITAVVEILYLNKEVKKYNKQ